MHRDPENALFMQLMQQITHGHFNYILSVFEEFYGTWVLYVAEILHSWSRQHILYISLSSFLEPNDFAINLKNVK